MSLCSLCQKQIEGENLAVISMGAYANPRYICDDCSKLIETAQSAREYDEIAQALDTLSSYMTEHGCDDPYVIEAMDNIMSESSLRASAIKEGIYDFSLDEEEGEEYEVPEDLQETEEDRELDRRDREAEEKMDKFMNWAWVGVAIGFVIYLVWLIFLR